MKSVTIFAIKRYALHDGPNIRTTIFLKGCPLRCEWCHNPEGIDFKTEIIIHKEKCIGCASCVESCPQSALRLENSTISKDQKLCRGCGTCVERCPALAQEATGKRVTTDYLLDEIRKDLPFYDRSKGGVTFSGGEPLSQPEGLLTLLEGCRKFGIHRAVDTSCAVPKGVISDIAAHAELFLVDLKHMDSAIHKRFTGIDNQQIHSNLELLHRLGVEIRIRIPLLSGINDTTDNIKATGRFVARLNNITGIDLLPYHSFGSTKYQKLGYTVEPERFSAPDKTRLHEIETLLKNYCPDIRIGG